MFTGIVQGRARVAAITDHDGVRTMRLAFPAGALDAVKDGASIAIEGVCLTVTSHTDDHAVFDCIEETLLKTTLGRLKASSYVNFERSARFGDEVGGHVVSGHIIGTGEVVEHQAVDDNLRLRIRPPDAARPFILHKGFVAIDGISLTVGAVSDSGFDLHLIPETLRLTTLSERLVGDPVNVEVDPMTQAVVSTVERIMAARAEV